MNKWAQILLGSLAAGASQFGILVAAGVTQALPLIAGVVGSIGITAGAMLKELPRAEWTDEKRDAKQVVKDENAKE